MSKTTYERGETLVYPNHYPTLTFTPIFGHRGDFMWIEEVKAAWPEHDSEFAFVRDTVHDERVDRLKAENEKLRERVSEIEELTDHRHYIPQEWYATLQAENAKLRELVSLMDKRDVLLPCWRGCDAFCRFYGSHCERIGTLMNELGFEVDE